MIRRLLSIFTHKHTWVRTYKSYYGDSRYACLKCGKYKKIDILDEGSWRVRRTAKGDDFEWPKSN